GQPDRDRHGRIDEVGRLISSKHHRCRAGDGPPRDLALDTAGDGCELSGRNVRSVPVPAPTQARGAVVGLLRTGRSSL
ncbi:MAG: hypothetical protein AVDCRST_MAG75-2429, partial [uncultured Propionibacteriaceae bacterium]